jgi:hypothetical protein
MVCACASRPREGKERPPPPATAGPPPLERTEFWNAAQEVSERTMRLEFSAPLSGSLNGNANILRENGTDISKHNVK